MSVVKFFRIKRFLSFVSVLLMVTTGTLMGAGAARADQAGVTWTGQTSAADNGWYSVTFGNGLFVAVANSGTGNRVMTSPDGIVWTSRTSAADNAWFSVAYGNGLFVAVAITGTGNKVMTSPDGIAWTIRASAADNAWISVAYANGMFVAVAYTGTGNRVMTSGLFSSASSTNSVTVPAVPDVFQAVGRPSTGCATYVSTGGDNKGNIAGTGWNPSWAQWVNGGLGGDVCVRMLGYNMSTSSWFIR